MEVDGEAALVVRGAWASSGWLAAGGGHLVDGVVGRAAAGLAEGDLLGGVPVGAAREVDAVSVGEHRFYLERPRCIGRAKAALRD